VKVLEKKVDEKILDYINAMEDKELRKDICAGPVRINDCFYEFEETEFFDGQLKMYIPNTFFDMPFEARKFKYPSENRPEIIKCNSTGGIVITFNVIDSPLNDDYVENLLDMMILINKRLNPANIIFDQNIVEIDSKKIGYYDFKSPALDDSLYNFVFLLEFKEKTLMGTFSCGYSNHKQWKDDIVFQMINTIRVKKEDEN